MSRRGLFGNAFYTAWSSLLGLVAVPLLIRAIGVEAYGVVGLLLITQALLLALDLGLSAAVNRYVARYVARSDLPAARNLLASLSPLYLLVGLAILLGCIAVAPWIARDWLRVVDLPAQVVADALVLIGAIIAVRWCLALYQAALIGAGRVDLSSRIGVVAITLAQVGGVLVAMIGGELVYYFGWLLCCAAGQTLALRAAAWRVLHHREPARRRWASIRSVYRFSLAMAGVSLTGMLLMQADKLLLSRAIPLDDFALYSLAWTLSSGLYVILTPTFNVIAPRFAGLVATGDDATLTAEYRRFSRIFAATLFPVVAGGVIAGGDILAIFAGDAALVLSVRHALILLLIGVALNGVMHFPYALQLAAGRGTIALTINLFLCALFFPLLTLLIDRFGATGAAAAWCLIQSSYLLVGAVATRWLIPQHPALVTWLGGDILPSAALTVLIMGVSAGLCHLAGMSGWVLIATTTVSALISIALSLRLFAGLRIRELYGVARDSSSSACSETKS